jgi:hypothetical protein
VDAEEFKAGKLFVARIVESRVSGTIGNSPPFLTAGKNLMVWKSFIII